MQKNTSAVQGYFNRWKGTNELHFVKGMPFFKLSDARAQALNLKEDPEAIIVTVTREQAFAEAAASEGSSIGDAPITGEPGAGTQVSKEPAAPKVPEKVEIADTDSDIIKAAKEKFNAAIDARLALAADATNPIKSAATRAITKAKTELDALTIAAE